MLELDGTLKTQIELISADLISGNPPNPCHPCSMMERGARGFN